jgi:mannitol-1-phosphate 5-dehydrogenase
MGHAVAAYHGFLSGRGAIHECMEEPGIVREVEGAMRESARALLARRPDEFTGRGLEGYVADLLRRFRNRALADTVFRVGRDLRRKLGPDDRFVGALRLCLAEGVDPAHIIRGVAAALRFRATDESGKPYPGDAALHEELAARGVRALIAEVSGLDPAADSGLIERVAREYESLG